MFTKQDYEKYKTQVENQGAFTMDVSRTQYIIFGTVGLTVFRRFGSSYRSKHIADWRNKTYAQVRAELQAQLWKDEG